MLSRAGYMLQITNTRIRCWCKHQNGSQSVPALTKAKCVYCPSSLVSTSSSVCLSYGDSQTESHYVVQAALAVGSFQGLDYRGVPPHPILLLLRQGLAM